MSKKYLKKYGLSTNIVYANKHIIYNPNTALMVSFGKNNMLENNTDSQVVLSGNKVDIILDDKCVKTNNQLYVKRNDSYITAMQSECFTSVSTDDNVHTQIAYNIDKIKKAVAYYVNNIIYALNKVGGYQNEDVISIVNYCISWDNYNPSLGSSSIQTKDDFNTLIYNIASHNSLYNNVFKFKNRWTLNDYLSADDSVHEYNYDVIRTISLLRNYTAHGNENNRHSLYIFSSSDDILKGRNIQKYQNLEKIISSNLKNEIEFDFKNIEENANIIFKTIKLFYIDWYKKYQTIDQAFYNSIVEKLINKKSDFQFSLKKLSRVFISKTVCINEKDYHRHDKYYDYLSKKQKSLFEEVIYFYLTNVIDDFKIKKEIDIIFRDTGNYLDIFNWLTTKKPQGGHFAFVPLVAIPQLVKMYYLICKKEIRLFAKTVNAEVYNEKRKFDIDIHEANYKEIYDEVFLYKHFESKAQLLCNINKVVFYKEGQRVRNLSYHGQKLQKAKLWSISKYIDEEMKRAYWSRTEKEFLSDYYKQRYIQIRNSICKRVFLTILYTNNKYYKEYVWNFDRNDSFSDYLTDKSRQFNKDVAKSLLYDYDHLKIKQMKYSGKMKTKQTTMFISTLFFLSNFIDKGHSQMLMDSIQRRLENINGLMEIWLQLDDHQLDYQNTLSIFNKTTDILNDLYFIKSFVKLGKIRSDSYEQITLFVKKCLISMNVKEELITENLLNQIYKKTKYFDSMIRYIDPLRVNQVISNKKLMTFGLSTLNKDERSKYLFDTTNEEIVLKINLINECNDPTKIVNLMTLIGSILNSIVSKLIGINAKYYSAFSCLERDLNIVFGSTVNLYKIDGRKAMLLAEDYISKLDDSKTKYVNEFNARRLIYAQKTYPDYRNTIEHIHVLDEIYNLDSMDKIDSFFSLYHYLIQKYLFSNKQSFINTPKYEQFRNDFNTFGTPSREMIKVMNLPFAYNPARYNKLSYKSVFIGMEEVFDDKKRFF